MQLFIRVYPLELSIDVFLHSLINIKFDISFKSEKEIFFLLGFHE